MQILKFLKTKFKKTVLSPTNNVKRNVVFLSRKQRRPHSCLHRRLFKSIDDLKGGFARERDHKSIFQNQKLLLDLTNI